MILTTIADIYADTYDLVVGLKRQARGFGKTNSSILHLLDNYWFFNYMEPSGLSFSADESQSSRSSSMAIAM